MAADAVAGSTLFRSLRERNYLLYFLGQLASMCGTWAQTVALSWLVLDLTGKGGQVGGVIALQYGTLLLVSPVAGVVTDRMDRRRAVICAETFLAVQATTLAAVVITGTEQLWMLYALAAAQGAGTALEQPARQSLLSELVEPRDLPNAIALNGTLFTLARIAGPAIAGALIVTVGIGPCFALNAASFIAIIFAVLAMRPSEMYHRAPVNAERGQIREGLHYVLSHRLVRMLVAGPVVTGMYMGVSAAVYPLLAKFTFDGNAGTYGLMGTLLGIGSAVGALSVARVTHVTTRLIMAVTAGTGAALLASALAPTLAIEYVVLLFVGGFTLAQAVSSMTKVQLATPPELRGRVVALYFMVSASGAALGSLVLGALAQEWGPRWAIAVNAGVAFVLASAWMMHRRNDEPAVEEIV